MSNSLSPWILEFLLDIGKEFGAKLYNVQPYPKKKKVQITEFLTYPDEEDDTPIWARISDKKHLIIVKFSKDAVRTFKENSRTRLTQNKGAIVSISKFRPISSRFPLEVGRMSTEAFVLFECEQVSLIGSPGEPTFGQPKGIEHERDIDLWSRGVAQDGGAGNVLRARVLGAGGKKDGAMVLPPVPAAPAPAPQPSLRASDRKLKPLVKRLADTDLASHKATWQILERSRETLVGPDTTTKSPTQPKSEMRLAESDRSRAASNWNSLPHKEDKRPMDEEDDTDLASHKAIWQFLERSREALVGPDTTKSPTQPKSEMRPEQEGTQDRSRSATPISNWNSSPHKENKKTNDDEDEKAEDLEFEDPKPRSEVRNKLSSSLPAPTPAQRVKKPAGSPLELGNETQMSPGTRQQRSTLARKVPRPASPEPLPAEQTGPGRVLVPNSDTSQQSYSQPSQQVATSRPVYLGGLVSDTSQAFPWLSMRDIGGIWRTASELRLRNDSN